MDTIKINKNKTLMICHRGLSGFETENSMPAFIAGGNHSYYGMECDIHPTLDNVLVVMHDSNVKRVSGVDLVIENSLYEDVKKIRLKGKDQENKEYLTIPLFTEYLDCCKRYNKIAVVEFKEKFSKENIIQTINIVKEYQYLDKTIFISFYPDNLLMTKEICKEATCQLLLSEYLDYAIPLLVEHKIDLDIYYGEMTKERVDYLHSLGIKINVWTVDKEEDGNHLASIGVDFITTNILE